MRKQLTEKEYLKLLDEVPTPMLLKAAKERNAHLRESVGPYAAQMKFTPCPHCGERFGVRQLRKHKPRCKANPNRMSVEGAA